MGRLRIIGGDWRSRLITTPDGLDTRPLTDRIRQSLFDCLGQRLDGLVVADCFAGSGSFGFEALSRGAAVVHAVEAGPAAVACLRANASSLQTAERHHIHAQRLPAAADRLPPCDLIFMDPPFPWFAEQAQLLATVAESLSKRLKPAGTLLLRGESGAALPPIPHSTVTQTRNYGRSWVAWIQSNE